jgi:hypothetical protein
MAKVCPVGDLAQENVAQHTGPVSFMLARGDAALMLTTAPRHR